MSFIIKFSLDPEIDASLIAKIEARAGEKSPSRAAKIMMREWSYFEDMWLKGQNWTTTGPLRDHLGTESGSDESFDLSALDQFNP